MRLQRRGRVEDPEFAATERLFRRYKGEHFVHGQFANMGLPFRTPPSVNREKYSVPDDVLISKSDEFMGWGVLSFSAGDVPPSFPPELPTYTFFPQHKPMDDNYGHSEVHCDTLPMTGGYVEPGAKVRKLVRTFLSQRIQIEIVASI